MTLGERDEKRGVEQRVVTGEDDHVLRAFDLRPSAEHGVGRPGLFALDRDLDVRRQDVLHILAVR